MLPHEFQALAVKIVFLVFASLVILFARARADEAHQYKLKQEVRVLNIKSV